ncbi:ABC transporter substrate-binding protein [Xanthobacter autotrophicus]|uniref:ABC transporter substrate-binding protein n=1 Tax=Xanthobacter TaxID=279 RepID=UPI0024AA307F|nr:ABC transporter substrate-binding protein [Xanthobacter autotrophicus]MDI4665698.1 ABC transporter substrate-binding protein [Xanthobacter autotrophicus]
MLTRRRMLALSAGVLSGAAVLPARAATAAGPPLRLGLLQFGTGAWEIAAMTALGLDAAHGVALVPQRFATNDAGRIAFQAGAVDAILSDLLWAARVKAEGRDLVYLPFSSAEGAVMVPAGSPINTVADLAGKRLGVAGGALDKSWLMLKAHAQAQAGLDLQSAAQPVFAAPPLLAAELEQGHLDAALLYWTFCARLEPKGYRRLVSVEDLVRSFGVPREPTLVGYVFDGTFARANPETVAAFARASRATKAALAGEDPARTEAAWAAARREMQAPDEATFAALRRGFIAGVPRLSPAEEEAAAAQLYAVLARLGGERLVGPATRLPPDLYFAPEPVAR